MGEAGTVREWFKNYIFGETDDTVRRRHLKDEYGKLLYGYFDLKGMYSDDRLALRQMVEEGTPPGEIYRRMSIEYGGAPTPEQEMYFEQGIIEKYNSRVESYGGSYEELMLVRKEEQIESEYASADEAMSDSGESSAMAYSNLQQARGGRGLPLPSYEKALGVDTATGGGFASRETSRWSGLPEGPYTPGTPSAGGGQSYAWGPIAGMPTGVEDNAGIDAAFMAARTRNRSDRFDQIESDVLTTKSAVEQVMQHIIATEGEGSKPKKGTK